MYEPDAQLLNGPSGQLQCYETLHTALMTFPDYRVEFEKKLADRVYALAQANRDDDDSEFDYADDS
jgi:hypothetical protein